MNTFVRFDFDFNFFPPDYSGERAFELVNPAVIPNTGDIVDVQIESFFDDPDVVTAFNIVKETNMFYAERVCTTYKKDSIVVLLMIYTPECFRQRKLQKRRRPKK